MKIQPKKGSVKAPGPWFTGDVWSELLSKAEPPSQVRVSAIHFAPGARTAWHSHSTGQTLYVTQGQGRAQARGGELTEISPGDTVWTPAGEWHWHGAAPDHVMTHVSITDGGGAGSEEWGDPVTDDEYNGH
jgi:quercetin dioxygenase-like cupin family protein